MAEFEVFDDPLRFRDEIAELVDRDPVGATMLSGVLAGQIADPAPAEIPLLACVRDVDGPAVAVLCTPSYPLLVVVDPQRRDLTGATGRLVDGLLDLAAPIVGFHGRREVVRDVAAAWRDRTGAAPRPRMRSLYYRLTGLVEPAPTRGTARPLTADDPAEVALLGRWLREFELETGVAREGHAADAEFVRRAVRRGTVYVLWRLASDPVDRAVSVAGHSPLRADGGCRIAPVYTPPECRRERFGAAVTAAAVRSAWALGAAEVTLFTDADYPASNELYRSLGFAPIAEFAEFDVPAAASQINRSASTTDPVAAR